MNEQEYEIIIDILSDTTSVPNILLENFREFKLTEKETLFLISVLHHYGQKKSMVLTDLIDALPYKEKDTEKILAKLIDKGFLCVKNGSVSLYCLTEKLREAWGWREAKAMRLAAEQQRTSETMAAVEEDFAILYNKVEAEFGRPLSPIENETVKDWYFTMKMPAPLIYEALKRAVLNNKRSFQYIKKILLDWQSKGYRCLEDLNQEAKPAAAENKRRKPKDSFREHQNPDVFEDIFEVE